MARLGQCFSTSLDTVGITLQEGVRYRVIDDVERGGYCFSDGIGAISSALAREVILHLSFLPSFVEFKVFRNQERLATGEKGLVYTLM